MLKKLRNKMLMINMISTFFLIILAFSVIFAITYNNVQQDINESLFRAFSFHGPFKAPEHGKNHPNRGGEEKPQRVLRDMHIFSVFVEKDGTVRTDSMFGENSEHYKTVANAALMQNSLKGEFKSESIVWRFDTHIMGNGEKIIALADITAEKSFLRQLIITFVCCAAGLLIIVFALSLLFANRAISPVREAWEKQKQFVADASHELKTPLAAINTNIDVLLSQSDKTIAEQEKWLKYIKKEAERLTNLTGSLLFMAKMNGEPKVEMKRVNFSEIAEAAVLNMEAVAFENGIRFDYDIEGNIFLSRANESNLTRLCLILLDNAVKYSKKDSTVDIRLFSDNAKSASFCVRNDSEPIPPEEVGKIFDRFYRVDKSRSSEGYGLGLAMAKEITELHKGKIAVKSTQEYGTEFTVTLPL